jgi:hypothetical protein
VQHIETSLVYNVARETIETQASFQSSSNTCRLLEPSIKLQWKTSFVFVFLYFVVFVRLVSNQQQIVSRHSPTLYKQQSQLNTESGLIDHSIRWQM